MGMSLVRLACGVPQSVAASFVVPARIMACPKFDSDDVTSLVNVTGPGA